MTTGDTYLSTLQHRIATHFSRDELADLCLRLGVSFDSLPDAGLAAQTREFILALARQERLPQLLTAAREDGRVTVLLGLRADFTGRLTEVEELRARVEQSFALLGPVQQEDLVRVIAEPARKGGWAFVSGLVEQILSDVGQEPGRLPLLSHALLETWQRRAGHVMTLRGYREAGGVEGAIAKTAEDTLRRLDEANEQPIMQAIFLSLTELGEGSEDTRRIARRDELARTGDPAVVDGVLNTLAAARLVTIDRKKDEVTVEVAHEALIRRWPRLREWLADNRERLRLERQLEEATREWERFGRDPSMLYRGGRLAQGLEWQRDGYPLSPLAVEFLASSEARAKEEERQERRLALADMVRREVRSHRLSDAAENMLARNDWETALLLATAAYQTTNIPDATTTGEARAALYHALNTPYRGTLAGHTGSVTSAAFSPNGTRVVTAGGDNTARLWAVPNGDAASGDELAVLAGHKDEVMSAAFSPDGTRVVTASRDGTARLWAVLPVDILPEAQRRLLREPTDVIPNFCERYFQDAPDECPDTLDKLFPKG